MLVSFTAIQHGKGFGFFVYGLNVFIPGTPAAGGRDPPHGTKSSTTKSLVGWKFRRGKGSETSALQLAEATQIIPYPTAFPYGNGMVLHF